FLAPELDSLALLSRQDNRFHAYLLTLPEDASSYLILQRGLLYTPVLLRRGYTATTLWGTASAPRWRSMAARRCRPTSPGTARGCGPTSAALVRSRPPTWARTSPTSGWPKWTPAGRFTGTWPTTWARCAPWSALRGRWWTS